ncbi:RelA/SpoT family protein, partial [Psychrobacter sp. 1Y4]
MVKIREGLPLVDGQTTQADSAALAAQLVASQRSHQSANSYAQIPLDIKYQLSTHKLHTTFDRSAAHTYDGLDPTLENEYLDNTYTLSDEELESIDLDQANIDVPTWLDNVAKRIGQESVPHLSAACEFIRSHMNTSESERSGAYVTGIGMTD